MGDVLTQFVNVDFIGRAHYPLSPSVFVEWPFQSLILYSARIDKELEHTKLMKLSVTDPLLPDGGRGNGLLFAKESNVEPCYSKD